MSVRTFGTSAKSKMKELLRGNSSNTNNGGAKAQRLPNELTFSSLPDPSNSSSSNATCLLLCDPQVDFHAGGAMPAAKADEISQRIAGLIHAHGAAIDDIYVTLQLRPSYHIGHPCFWQDENGNPPEPFVHIDATDLASGRYLAARKEHKDLAGRYMEALVREKGVHNVVVFPEHCVVGTRGAAVVDCVAEALRGWERRQKKAVHYIAKGTCSRTEQFSCFSAVLPQREDDATLLNRALLARLQASFSRIVVLGHTLSHAVKYSIQDLINNPPARGADPPELILIQDCCACLRDFKNGADHFLAEMRDRDDVIVTNSSNAANVFGRDQAAVFDINTPAAAADEEVLPLGAGCYLMYDETNFGSLSAVWTRGGDDAERLAAHVAFFRPGAAVKIPGFKFANEGRQVIVREINKGGEGRKKKLFKGVLRFLQEAKTFEGVFIIREAESYRDDVGEFGIYALREDNAIVTVKSEEFVDPGEFRVVACIPKAAHAFQGVTKQPKDIFISNAEKIGATLELK